MCPEKRPKTKYIVVAAPKKAAKRPKRAPRQCRRASFEFPDLDPLPGVQLDLPGFEDMPQFTTPDFLTLDLDPIPTCPSLIYPSSTDMPPVPDIPLLFPDIELPDIGPSSRDPAAAPLAACINVGRLFL